MLPLMEGELGWKVNALGRVSASPLGSRRTERVRRSSVRNAQGSQGLLLAQGRRDATLVADEIPMRDLRWVPSGTPEVLSALFRPLIVLIHA
jgi:hypothetical protein